LSQVEDWPNITQMLIGLNPRKPLPRLTPRGSSPKIEIAAIHFVALDIDPVRPKGVPASFEERLAAVMVGDAIVNEFRKRGHGNAWLMFTGNGARVIVRIPRVDATKIAEFVRKYKVWTKEVGRKFETAQVKIDALVANASSLIPIPGTTNRKGVAMDGRSYRRVMALVAGDTEPSQSLRRKIDLILVPKIKEAAEYQHLLLAPSDPAKMEQCNLVRFMIEQLHQTGNLSHRERMALGTLGNALGDPGREWVHEIMREASNYNARATMTQLNSLSKTPYTCGTIERILQETYGKEAPERCPTCNGKQCVPTWLARRGR